MRKILTIILKVVLSLAILVVLALAIIGRGWGSKNIAHNHPFYSGDLIMVAHRGVTDVAPENTIASAARAKELGFKFIELDLKQSKDHRFFLFHDRDPKRLFGTDISLNTSTLSELQQVPLLHKGSPSSYRVPELEDFTRRFSEDLTFYLDIKRHGNYQYRKLAQEIMNFLERNKLSDQCLVGSDFLFTTYLEFHYPQLHTVFTGPGDWTIVFYKWIPKRFRPDLIISYAEEVTEWHLDWLRRNDLTKRRMLYGVNGDNYRKVREWGIPWLVVDYDPVMNADL